MTETDYYVQQKKKLLKNFDRAFGRIQKLLAKTCGDDFAAAVTAETRREYERLIPALPYIGGSKNFYTPIIIVNGWIIALFRVMRARGKTAEETVKICVDVLDEMFRSRLRFLFPLMRWAAFSRFFRRMLKKQAAQSQRRLYPGDFVYTLEEGDGEPFDFAVVFSECAVNKLYEAQGVEELKPYCNFFDILSGHYAGLGVTADETIGLGCERCVLSYKRGGETKIVPSLATVMSAHILE